MSQMTSTMLGASSRQYVRGKVLHKNETGNPIISEATNLSDVEISEPKKILRYIGEAIQKLHAKDWLRLSPFPNDLENASNRRARGEEPA
ncbi:hypothetical protein VTK26DRAFT_154 [Humicola hyalothermophila]